MSRKKKQSKQAQAKEKSFSNNPFSDLKGLSVSRPEEPPAKAPSPPKKVPPAISPAGEFLEEMSLLGVKAFRRDSDGEPAPRAPEEPPGAAREEEQAPLVQGEDELFLQAMGELDVTFEDEIPPPAEVAPAAPRRMREVARGRKVPEAELDLHGLGREQARAKVGFFLENSRHHGLQTVLVITGRGQHSSEEPVLRSEIERFLAEEGRQWAVEWGRAPRRLGGDGALVIFLKSNSKGRD